MPYITQKERNELEFELDELRSAILDSAQDGHRICGVLNYVFSNLLDTVPELKNEGTWNYDSINAAIGVLECCKLELYRRLGAEKEDAAIKKNGDIILYEKMKI